MFTILRPAFVLFVILSAITGLLYPLLVTGVGRVAFPSQASGSLVERDGKVVGSALLGQPFGDPGHFWSRPSATSPMPYNAAASSGSNLGPNNPALVEAVRARVTALRAADPGNTARVPIDLVTSSASGLDPDITLAAAYYQAARVARARGMAGTQLNALIAAQAIEPVAGFLGEPRVNVLRLNLALDAAK